MNTFIWNKDNLDHLGKKFLRHILDNMRGYEGTVVRFGLTGEGIQPNYQITFPNGIVRPINGISHKLFKKDGFDAHEFSSDRLSQPFTLLQIQNAYQS